MPGTVWGTASNLTAKFRSAPCLPPNTDKPLTRGPVPRQPSSQPLSAQASPQQRSRVHRYNVTHTTKSNFAGLLRIHAAIDTWLMTLFIQRAEHRDTQAIHAKLDELLRVEGRARNELTQLDDEEPEVIEQHRSEERSGLESGR